MLDSSLVVESNEDILLCEGAAARPDEDEDEQRRWPRGELIAVEGVDPSTDKDCSAFSKALLISLTLIVRRFASSFLAANTSNNSEDLEPFVATELVLVITDDDEETAVLTGARASLLVTLTESNRSA